MIRNFPRIKTRSRASCYSFLALTAIISLVSISFMNWSRAGFQSPSSSDRIAISTSCQTIQKVSQLEIFNLINEAHDKTNAGQRIRCPGFFAEIDNEIPSLSLQQRQLSEFNNCNINGPLRDEATTGEKNPTRGNEDLIRELVAKTNFKNILETMTVLSDGSLGVTRYHASSNPRRAPEWILEQFKKIANGRADIHIRLVEHSKTKQPSVEAIIEGVGPDKDKFVIIGGHEDSINGSSSSAFVDSSAPGADDNASGVGTVLETFRVLAESGIKPNASIAFYTYAAEEVGLVGSQEIARSYSDAGKEVLGVVQIDMSAFSTGPIDEMTFITDFTSSTLTATAANIAIKYLGMKVSYDTCGYACSDHASWTRYNFRSILPAEKEVWASVKRIHSVKDKIDDFVKPMYAEKFSKLCIALALTLAGS